MKNKPINFSQYEVQALLAGRLTQVRRLVKPQPASVFSLWPDSKSHVEWDELVENQAYYVACSWCPFGEPGDHLWAREAWAVPFAGPYQERVTYQADGELNARERTRDSIGPWRSPYRMPKRFSRFALEVTGVRVARLQDIDDENATYEGCIGVYGKDEAGVKDEIMSPVEVFAEQWDVLNTKRGFGWDANPWVWIVKFKQIKQGETS